MRRITLRPSPALFVATAALFVALGGGAYAVPRLSATTSPPKPFVVRHTMTLKPMNSPVSGFAKCPKGSFATGGGVGAKGGATDTRPAVVLDSGPTDRTGSFAHTKTGTHPVRWFGTAVNNGGSSPITEYVWVICEKLS